MDASRKKVINDDLKVVNAKQRMNNEERRTTELNRDLSEGRQMVKRDMEGLDMEQQLMAFKRQLFTQEMVSAWTRQNKYKKNMKKVEDQF